MPITFIGKLETNDADKTAIMERLGIDFPREQVELKLNPGLFRANETKDKVCHL